MDEKDFLLSTKGDGPGKFTLLLLFSLGYLFVAPFLLEFLGLRFLMIIFLSGILISGIYSVNHQGRISVIAAILAIPMFAMLWAYEFTSIRLLATLGDCFGILYLSFLAVLILKAVIHARRVTRDVICGAVVVYLFLGFIWGFVFSLIETVQPGSFSISVAATRQQSAPLFNYFSFVTLTTLGYGDISPLSAPARSFSYLEALIGQIYLTVLVARLVGVHISQALEKDS